MIAINLNNFCKGNRASGKTGGGPVPWEELFCNSGASFLQEVGFYNAWMCYTAFVYFYSSQGTLLKAHFITVEVHLYETINLKAFGQKDFSQEELLHEKRSL